METVSEGAFSAAILDGVRARGQAIKIIPASASGRSQLGFWTGIQIVSETHKMNGAVTSLLPGMVEGYLTVLSHFVTAISLQRNMVVLIRQMHV